MLQSVGNNSDHSVTALNKSGASFNCFKVKRKTLGDLANWDYLLRWPKVNNELGLGGSTVNNAPVLSASGWAPALPGSSALYKLQCGIASVQEFHLEIPRIGEVCYLRWARISIRYIPSHTFSCTNSSHILRWVNPLTLPLILAVGHEVSIKLLAWMLPFWVLLPMCTDCRIAIW